MSHRHAAGRNIERVLMMSGALPILFEEACVRLPLFDGLPVDVVDRLAMGGFGRGLLTATLRTRLRKAGFADMAALALATPADLMAVRKIGPVRVHGIRAHVLDELARLVPGARMDHGREATDRHRLDRLRAVPGGWPLPGGTQDGRFGLAWADLASMPRAEAIQVLGISASDLESIVSALARALSLDQLRSLPVSTGSKNDPEREARARTELQQDRNREWEEAAPTG